MHYTILSAHAYPCGIFSKLGSFGVPLGVVQCNSVENHQLERRKRGGGSGLVVCPLTHIHLAMWVWMQAQPFWSQAYEG